MMKLIKMSQNRLHEESQGIQESDIESSDEDDKTQPAYWKRDDDYMKLPDNVRNAIEMS